MKRIKRMLETRWDVAGPACWPAGGVTTLLLGLMTVWVLSGSIEPVCAEDPPVVSATIKDHPGYLDFDIKAFAGDAEPKVEMFLNKAQIAMMIGAAQHAGSETQSVAFLLNHLNLELVKFQVFEGAKVDNAAINTKVNELIEAGWFPTFRVVEGKNCVNILVNSQEDMINGFVGIISSGAELIYFNVVGSNNATELGKKIGQFLQMANAGQLDVEAMLKQAMGQGQTVKTTETEIQEFEYTPSN